MRPRRFRLGRRAAAVLAGSALGLSAGAATGTTVATAATTCTRHAAAVDVGLNGKVIWQTPMPATSYDYQTSFTPAAGPVMSYWPEDGIVHALRNKDGHQLWEYAQGLSLNGVWLTKGVVSVLSDDFGGGGVLSGLDAGTGQLRWQVKLPGKGLDIDGPHATADGGLAWVRADGVLQVIDLATGKARFSVREGTTAQISAQFPQLVAYAGRLFYLAGGRLSAYDDVKGKLAWSLTALPVHTTFSLVAGRLMVNGGWPAAAYRLQAIDPAAGTMLWQFDVGVSVTVLTNGSGDIALEPTEDTMAPHEYLIDEHTGLIVWQTTTEIFGTPIVIRAHDTIAVEGTGDYDKPALLVDRNLATGAVMWQTVVHHQAATAQTLDVIGTNVVINPDDEFAHPDNPLYAFSATTGKAAWSLGTLRPLQTDPVPLAKSVLLTTADDPDFCS